MMTSWNGNIFRVTGLCAGNSPVPVNSPHKGQWRGALLFFICVWINGWVNNREAGDLRRHRGHCDVSVMTCYFLQKNPSHIFTIYIIPPQRRETGSWNSASCKTRAYLFYIVNTMAASGKWPGHQQKMIEGERWIHASELDHHCFISWLIINGL